eukprot:scaffold291315_cov47-Attheya_sp.AAC.5
MACVPAARTYSTTGMTANRTLLAAKGPFYGSLFGAIVHPGHRPGEKKDQPRKRLQNKEEKENTLYP